MWLLCLALVTAFGIAYLRFVACRSLLLVILFVNLRFTSSSQPLTQILCKCPMIIHIFITIYTYYCNFMYFIVIMYNILLIILSSYIYVLVSTIVNIFLSYPTLSSPFLYFPYIVSPYIVSPSLEWINNKCVKYNNVVF